MSLCLRPAQFLQMDIMETSTALLISPLEQKCKKIKFFCWIDTTLSFHDRLLKHYQTPSTTRYKPLSLKFPRSETGLLSLHFSHKRLCQLQEAAPFSSELVTNGHTYPGCTSADSAGALAQWLTSSHFSREQLDSPLEQFQNHSEYTLNANLC